MGYRGQWQDRTQRVYILSINERWSWDDWHRGHDLAHNTVASVQHTVDLVVRIEGELPPGNMMLHLKRTGSSQPSNVYRTVFVAEHPLLLVHILRVLRKAQGWAGPKIVSSLEEAIDHINSAPRRADPPPITALGTDDD